MENCQDKNGLASLYPSDVLKIISSKLSHNMRFAFCSSIVIGLVTHLFFFMGKFSNHDDLIYYYRGSLMVAFGRIFFIIPSSLSSFFNLPWVLGVLSLLYISIGCMFIVDLLEINKAINIALLCATIITFPSWCATFSYLFTCDVYACAFMFSVLAVWLTKRFKYGFIFGAAALCFSLGLYQAYLACAMCLCLVTILALIFDSSKQDKYIFIYAGKCAAMGGIATGVYLALVKIAFLVTGINPSALHGYEKIGKIGVSDLFNGIINAYTYFFDFFIGNGIIYKSNILCTLYLISLMLVVVGIVFLTIVSQKSFIRLIISLGVLVLLPLAQGIIYVIAPNASSYHLLMFPATNMIIVLFITFVDATQKSGIQVKTRFKSAFIWAGAICIICIIWSWYLTTNAAYLNMHSRYEKTYGLALRMLDRVEQLEGYRQDMPIVIEGELDLIFNTQNKSAQIYLTTPEEIFNGITGVEGDYLCSDSYLMSFFMHDYLGKNFYEPELSHWVELEAKVRVTNEFNEMTNWPATDSVRIIDGVAVVRLS